MDRLLSRYLDGEQSGNYLDEATHTRTGKNIPHLRQSITEYAQSHNKDPKEFQKKLEGLRKKLFDTRENRVHPQLDDKVLTDWNGLMISAFAPRWHGIRHQNLC